MGIVKINGNGNQVYNDIKNSRINSNDEKENSGTTKNWSVWLTVIIAVLTLIATCIIGWDAIVGFFK